MLSLGASRGIQELLYLMVLEHGGSMGEQIFEVAKHLSASVQRIFSIGLCKFFELVDFNTFSVPFDVVSGWDQTFPYHDSQNY